MLAAGLQIKAAVIARARCQWSTSTTLPEPSSCWSRRLLFNVQTLVIDRGRNCSRILAPAKTHRVGEGLTGQPAAAE